MPRYRIPHTSECFAGWDNSLQSFWLQVWEPDESEEGEHLQFTTGTSPYGVRTVEALDTIAQAQGIDLSDYIEALRAAQLNAPPLTESESFALQFLTDLDEVLNETPNCPQPQHSELAQT